MTELTCMYCVKEEELQKLMIPICEIDGFPLYFMRNQTYLGRVVLAYNEHIGKVTEISKEKCSQFFLAVQKVAAILTEVFKPGQINIGMYADKMSHLHCHITPKYPDAPDWGGVFQMHPQPPVLLKEEEYQGYIKKIRNAAIVM